MKRNVESYLLLAWHTLTQPFRIVMALRYDISACVWLRWKYGLAELPDCEFTYDFKQREVIIIRDKTGLKEDIKKEK